MNSEERSNDGVPLWSCPECAFTFDAAHTDTDGGGYSCPLCAEIDLESRLDAALARIAAVEALTEQWDEMLRTCSAIMTTAQRNAWKNALAELRFALAASPTPTGGALQRAENFAAATTPAAAIAALVEGLPGPTPTGPEPECNGSWMTCEKHAPRSRND